MSERLFVFTVRAMSMDGAGYPPGRRHAACRLGAQRGVRGSVVYADPLPYDA